MGDLKIAPGLTLPAATAATETYAILARKGAGKTYTGLVMAEEMIGAGIQVVALDPLGAWWGLRADAGGKKAGLPVTILGGEHGDVPLESTAGKVIADLVVAHHGSFVLDLSLFDSNAQQDRFVTDFAERLYRAKAKGEHRTPLHLMVDEADSFAPQSPQPGQQRMLGAWEAIVRRGRIRGLGATLITQRPAVLNKNVLTQIECLVVLQMTGPQDRRAIDEWVKGNGTKEQRDEMMESLAVLERGDAWFWSPAWLRVFKRVHVRARHTFDSSRTPEAGEQPKAPTKLATVDLDVLRDQIAATIETAKANDPTVLRKEVARLERELRDQPAPRVEVREVQTFSPEQQAEMLEIADRLKGVADQLGDAAAGLRRTLAARKVTKRTITAPAAPVAPAAHRVEEQRVKVTGTPSGDVKLGRAHRAILTVLAQYPDGRTSKQTAILAGYVPGTGGFNNALGALRTAGYVNRGEPLRATPEGIEAVGDVDPLPTGQALIYYWMHHPKMGKAHKAHLQVLVDAWPESLPSDEVARRAGYEPGTGGSNNALGRLRTLQLIEGTRDITASPDLMEGTA